MVPFAGLTVLYAHFGDLLGHPPTFIGLVSGILFLWGLVEMSFVKGTSGPNRFGPDPLASKPETIPWWHRHSE